jgi:hypothetical protein
MDLARSARSTVHSLWITRSTEIGPKLSSKVSQCCNTRIEGDRSGEAMSHPRSTFGDMADEVMDGYTDIYDQLREIARG